MVGNDTCTCRWNVGGTFGKLTVPTAYDDFGKFVYSIIPSDGHWSFMEKQICISVRKSSGGECERCISDDRYRAHCCIVS